MSITTATASPCIVNIVTRRHPWCWALGSKQRYIKNIYFLFSVHHTHCFHCIISLCSLIPEHLTFSNHILLMNNVVLPGFMASCLVWVILMRPWHQSQPHFMATLPSLLRFKNIPKLTNLAIKKLYGLPLQAFCIHKI